MSKPIAIIGAGQDKGAIAAALAEQGHNDVIIMTLDEAKEYANNPFKGATDVYKIEAPPILKYVDGKEFICKGEHQYRQVEEKWICQCGRVL
jgi:hypothetical protein